MDVARAHPSHSCEAHYIHLQMVIKSLDSLDSVNNIYIKKNISIDGNNMNDMRIIVFPFG